MASLDSAFELIAVYTRKTDDIFGISNENLEAFLKPKKGIEPTKEQLIKSMKGIAYTKSPSGYIFKKVKE